ncbi:MULTISPECIES: hypothetical protein [unclassified Sulfitobacter]|uniref:hypothetical protein n=1 Tax=unclassified Sulfitobacter TaxID=196795 RepID=UPI0007C36D1E|nr:MULTISPECIES: hypothetical protein [unclassified Sulfitobacter]KZX93970.1 hypothetical protein A3721_10875 [Sulfitobacter sp. HI0023]KZY25045.1 hypothetical protein A3728_04140 [Sulfitobacter sp. HI0040]KZZ70246.1 hypothetical protein A3764_08190 [Sulfitobacter sp. HI0129]
MAVVALMIASITGTLGFLTAWFVVGTGLLIALVFYAAVGTMTFFAVIALVLLSQEGNEDSTLADTARA